MVLLSSSTSAFSKRSFSGSLISGVWISSIDIVFMRDAFFLYSNTLLRAILYIQVYIEASPLKLLKLLHALTKTS